MKYKKIITDKEINKQLSAVNKAALARKLGVSKTYLYEAIKEKACVTEEFYLKVKKRLRGSESK